jgi:cytoskeletal protein RodZ
MLSGFTRRKIDSKKTVGEILKSIRVKKELTLEQVEAGTKVRAKFLNAIERNDWKSLPSQVYIRSFVTAYCKFLEVEKSNILALLEAELNFQNLNRDFSYKKTIKEVKFVITPKILGYASASLFVLFMFGFIAYQVFSFAGSPNLKIINPNNNTVIETDSVDIHGLTDANIMLSVNNETIPVTNDGRFSTNLKLHRGINVIKVKATNKAKKDTTEIITVEYKPKTALIDTERNQ